MIENVFFIGIEEKNKTFDVKLLIWLKKKLSVTKDVFLCKSKN